MRGRRGDPRGVPESVERALEEVRDLLVRLEVAGTPSFPEATAWAAPA